MDRDRNTVAILSRTSAVVSVLGGLGIINFKILLTMLWTPRPFFAELLDMMREPPFIVLLLCAIAATALAPFIWRERMWAMLAALALSGGFLFMFGNETLFLKVSLSATTALFAICAGVRFWRVRPSAS